MTLEVTLEDLELLENALDRYKPREAESQAAEDLLDWTYASLGAAKRVPLGRPTAPPVPLKRSELEVAVAALTNYTTTVSKLKAKAAARRAAAKDRAAQMLADVAVQRAAEKSQKTTALLERARTLAST